MAKLTVGHTFTFHAAHFLPGYKGKCANMHGHTYKLEVEVEGPIGKDGMVCDFSCMEDVIDSLLIEKLDHKVLNDYQSPPTAEALVACFTHELESIARELTGMKGNLKRIRLYETENSWAEWNG